MQQEKNRSTFFTSVKYCRKKRKYDRFSRCFQIRTDAIDENDVNRSSFAHLSIFSPLRCSRPEFNVFSAVSCYSQSRRRLWLRQNRSLSKWRVIAPRWEDILLTNMAIAMFDRFVDFDDSTAPGVSLSLSLLDFRRILWNRRGPIVYPSSSTSPSHRAGNWSCTNASWASTCNRILCPDWFH